MGKIIGIRAICGGYNSNTTGITMKRKWVTKSGSKIRIRDMTTQHIKNCIRFLHKNREREFYSLLAASAMFSPDSMASYYAEQEIDNYLEGEPDLEFNEYIIAFKNELKRRNNG
jgi:hypothetical protein